MTPEAIRRRIAELDAEIEQLRTEQEKPAFGLEPHPAIGKIDGLRLRKAALDLRLREQLNRRPLRAGDVDDPELFSVIGTPFVVSVAFHDAEGRTHWDVTAYAERSTGDTYWVCGASGHYVRACMADGTQLPTTAEDWILFAS